MFALLLVATPAKTLDPNALLTALNAARTTQGQKILRLDPELSRLAQERLQTIAERETPEHIPEDTTALGQLGADYNFSGFLLAENISFGLNDPDMVTNAWLGSPTHRQNVLEPRFTIAGIASQSLTRGDMLALLTVTVFAGPPTATATSNGLPPVFLLGLAVAALLGVWLIVRLQTKGKR